MAQQKEVLNIQISVKVDELSEKDKENSSLENGPITFRKPDPNRKSSCTIVITGTEFMVQNLISPLIRGRIEHMNTILG